MKVVTKETDLHGRKLKIETGLLAQQADAAVLATWGDSVVLATVAAQPAEEPVNYFPLSVEYVEKYYAGGRITAQKFIKRETRPTEEAVLAGRAIDRAIRPLFPKEFTNAVQVIISVLSYDADNDPAYLGFIAASAALAISSVPWNGPVGAIQVGRVDGKLIINPTLSEKVQSDLKLTVVSTKEKVTMIETEGKEIPDEVVFDGIKQAHKQAQLIIDLINDLAKETSKEKLSISPVAEEVEEAVMKDVKSAIKQKIQEALADTVTPWHEATGEMIKKELAEKYLDVLTPEMVAAVFDKVAKEIMHDLILDQGKRVDGRSMEEIRPITMKIGLLPRTHGSAVFQRGGTQVLSIATLGPLSLSQTLEGMTGESTKRFMHHYNMGINPFSVGEVKRLGSPGRRDIGHGALAEKALVNVLPAEADFPYAIRVVSEILAANASTSMASVCATTLALLDAGVPLKNPVAGIAMGLMSEPDKNQVITDMQAVEDFYGDMDFKVTGTIQGITAIQMDTKLDGLTFDIIKEALKQGKAAREFIIGKITEVAPKAGGLSQYAPKIETIKINPDGIGTLIGTGGKTINGLIARTGTQIDVEDDGTVMVSAVDIKAVRQTIAEIEAMFREIEVGEEMEGTVVRIAPFGAFVEIAPGKDGLVHVSQMAPQRVENPEDVVSVGQKVKVRVTEVSPDGKVGLSMLFGENRRPETEQPRRGFNPNRHRFGRDRR